MRFSDVPHQRQSEATAFGVMHERIARAIKLLENFPLISSGDADAFVGNFQLYCAILAIKLHAEILLTLRILQRVIDEIHQSARDRFTIDFHRRHAIIDRFFQSKALLLDLVAIRIDRVAHEIRNVGFAEFILLAAGFDAREIKNVIDQRRQPLALFADDAIVLLLLFLSRDAAQLKCFSIETNQR